MEYKSTSLMPKKADLIIVALAALMALAVVMFFAESSSEKTAVILQNGKEITRIDLSRAERRELTVDGDYTNTIVCENGTVGVVHSTCPGEVCVGSGMISEAGKSVVCLPNRMEIRITGPSDVDVVVG